MALEDQASAELGRDSRKRTRACLRARSGRRRRSERDGGAQRVRAPGRAARLDRCRGRSAARRATSPSLGRSLRAHMQQSQADVTAVRTFARVRGSRWWTSTLLGAGLLCGVLLEPSQRFRGAGLGTFAHATAVPIADGVGRSPFRPRLRVSPPGVSESISDHKPPPIFGFARGHRGRRQYTPIQVGAGLDFPSGPTGAGETVNRRDRTWRWLQRGRPEPYFTTLGLAVPTVTASESTAAATHPASIRTATARSCSTLRSLVRSRPAPRSSSTSPTHQIRVSWMRLHSGPRHDPPPIGRVDQLGRAGGLVDGAGAGSDGADLHRGRRTRRNRDRRRRRQRIDRQRQRRKAAR